MTANPKAPRIGPKTAAAISHLVEGRARTQAKAADLAGMSRTELCRSLKKPHVHKYMLDQATHNLRGVPAVLAAARLASLVHSPSHEVAAKVSTLLAVGAEILDTRAGASGGGNALGIGPVLIVQLRHIGAPGVLIDAQPAEKAELHSLVQGGVDDSGGSPHNDGLEKTDERAASPLPRTTGPENG